MWPGWMSIFACPAQQSAGDKCYNGVTIAGQKLTLIIIRQGAKG